jgi:hypothetical protein
MRLRIIQPWWREPWVQNWTGVRHWLKYVVMQDRGLHPNGSPNYMVVAVTWTWRGAVEARKRARAAV